MAQSQQIIPESRGTNVTELAALFPKDLFDTNFETERPSVVTISRPVEPIFAFLRDFRNHSRFMKGVKEVSSANDKRVQWTADTEKGRIKWSTEIVKEKLNELIAWRTSQDSDFKYIGAFVLTPASGGRGTVVAFKLVSDSVLGRVSNSLAQLMLKDTDTQAYTCLRRLKALIETGEVPTTEGQPSGRAEDMDMKH